MMFVVFLRRMMSTWQWSRPDTSVGSQTTFCLSITLLLQSVARKCCSSQGSLCHSTRCLVCCVRNGARSVPRNLTRHRLERVLTRFVDTHPWTAVCISQQKSVAYHPCIESVTSLCWPVLHAQLTWYFVFTLRAWKRSWWLLYIDPTAVHHDDH